MAFVIIDTEGKPLLAQEGNLILVGSQAEAREFVMPGDQGVVSWEWWVAQNGQDGAS